MSYTHYFVDSIRPRIDRSLLLHYRAHSRRIGLLTLGAVYIALAVSLLLFLSTGSTYLAYAQSNPFSFETSLTSMCFSGDICKRTENDDVFHFAYQQLSEQDRKSLQLLVGTDMESAIPAIVKSSYRYQVPVAFTTGIANAESSLHEDYYMESDRGKCYNPWGLKPRNGMREDGSYLICFDSWEASTDYFNQLLREKYFDRGATTVKTIAPYYKCGGWDGSDSCLSTLDNWISNVSRFGYF